MLSHPTICVIGAGAVGGYYGARLAQHGNDVHFLLRNDYDAIRTNGWTIQSCDGDFALRPGSFGAFDDPKKLPKADLVLVTLKTTANNQFETLISPLIKQDTAILTLQNGLGNEEQLSALFGRERILGGMAFTCINRIGPGAIHHMAEGWIRIGEFTGGPSERATQIADLFIAAGIDCKVLDDLRRGRWEKLCWNIPFNGLGAVMDLDDGSANRQRSGRFARGEGNRRSHRRQPAAVGVSIPKERMARRQIEKTPPDGFLSDKHAGSIAANARRWKSRAILGEPLRQGGTAGRREDAATSDAV